MKFIWDEGVMSLPALIITIVVMVIFFAFLYYILFVVVKRRSAYILISVTAAIFILGFIFVSYPMMIIAASLLIGSIIIVAMINIGDLRKFLSNPFKKQSVKATSFKIEKIFDRESMYKEIYDAVLVFSKNRTGAIMTFEKNTSLNDVIKNGVSVHAPVSSELLQTIFYPGTRLHDGAVVIHNNDIIAASVFFTPSTKAFAGKYGSRHRAAIGISEISDAVTVVVSEETGRISLAVNGQLITVEPSEFLRVFETYMDSSAVK